MVVLRKHPNDAKGGRKITNVFLESSHQFMFGGISNRPNAFLDMLCVCFLACKFDRFQSRKDFSRTSFPAAAINPISKKDDDPRGGFVYLAHQADLVRPLGSIRLVDAEGVDPNSSSIFGVSEAA
jgi:hypothetical protein